MAAAEGRTSHGGPEEKGKGGKEKMWTRFGVVCTEWLFDVISNRDMHSEYNVVLGGVRRELARLLCTVSGDLCE